MKQIAILLLGIFVVSCSPNKKEVQNTTADSTAVVESTEHFDWLLGQWSRLNEEEGKETYEHWDKVSDTEYAGLGFTMQEADTIWQENMRLVKVDKNWDLMVQSPGESEPTVFKGTDHSATEFTCTNSKNDFPNTIKYWKDEDKLSALVSGGDLSISFAFERMSL
ncbi:MULTISPECIES: DUF6265 family protein [Reichenbachiella]|uniref:DUF6265 family protein n=1 Tax=Reichenbachiella TaxID=156993 RepID=UPI000ED9621A|nr:MULTISPECIES: DUF6265 family protein [Reichenbachiella]MBU2912749.1 hypothetical protein [Reichenbachiella agariperforans]RJE72434.1 hypothetical protein BGP76_00140 [Reichenbachiella sp. MSK19-1]